MSTAVEPAQSVSSSDGAVTSLPGHVLRHARERPKSVALRDKHLGRWRETTWKGYADRIARVAAGLRELGVVPGDRVAIHAENRPEWVVADLAIQALGAISVGLYPTSPEAEVSYLLGHCGAKVLIAEDEEQLDKALAVRGELPALEHLIVIEPRGVREEGVSLYSDLEATDPLDLEQAVAALGPQDTAILVYTSGTTGPAEGRHALPRQPGLRRGGLERCVRHDPERFEPQLPAALSRRRAPGQRDRRGSCRLHRPLR